MTPTIRASIGVLFSGQEHAKVTGVFMEPSSEKLTDRELEDLFVDYVREAFRLVLQEAKKLL